MPDIKPESGFIMILFIVLTLLFSVLVPLSFTLVNDNMNTTVAQSPNTTYHAHANLQTEIISHNTTHNNITIELTNTQTKTSSQISNLSVSENNTVSLDNSNIFVEYLSVSDTTYNILYSVNPYFGYPNGIQTIINYFPLLLIILYLLIVITIGLVVY